MYKNLVIKYELYDLEASLEFGSASRIHQLKENFTASASRIQHTYYSTQRIGSPI